MRFVAVFLFLLGPRLLVVDLHLVATVVLAALGSFRLVGRNRDLDTLTPVFGGLAPIIVYGLISGLASGGADFTIATIFLKFALYMLAAVGVVSLYDDGRRASESELSLLTAIILSSVLNGVFVLLFVVSSGFRQLSTLILDLEQKDHWVETGFRGVDMSIGGGATASVFFATAALIALRHARSFRSSWVGVLAPPVLAIAALLTGRTGLVLLMALVPMALAIALAFPVSARKPPGFALISPALVGVSVALGAVALWTSDGTVAVHMRDVVLPWALEGITVGGFGGERNESLERILSHMYFLPPFDWQVVLGTFNAGRSEWLPYVASDVGYVRVVYAVGVLGLVLVTVAHLPMVFFALRHAGHSCVAFGIGVSLVLLVVTNFKELNLASRGSGPLLALLIAAAALLWKTADVSAQGRQE